MKRLVFYLYKLFTSKHRWMIFKMMTDSFLSGWYRWYDMVGYEQDFDNEINHEPCPIEINCSTLKTHLIKNEKSRELVEQYLCHRFDLLGSGWADVGYLASASGRAGYDYSNPSLKIDTGVAFFDSLMNKRKVTDSRRMWSALTCDYHPIDWQKDFITGYRWKNDEYYRPTRLSDQKGADIKVPWELSRLQHLPRLAIFSKVFPDQKDRLMREFQNQIRDFMATNLVRYGVNYMCTMDVGIRMANVALAYSLFKENDRIFDDSFEQDILKFTIETCGHIYHNLEWSETLTSNHYFADVAGLLFGAAILPPSRKREKWIKFAAREINREIIKQFHPEGSNGEGSTAYHRLTSEMAVYSIALMKYLERKGESIHVDRTAEEIIYKSGLFLLDLMRPDDSFTQIGDNDSGLFFRLSVTGEIISAGRARDKYADLASIPGQSEAYLDENMNDGRPFLSAVYGLSGDERLKSAADVYPLEASLVRCLIGDRTPSVEMRTPSPSVNNMGTKAEEIKLPYQSQIIHESGRNDLTIGLRVKNYQEFGVMVFRGENIYLCINYSDNGQKGNAGHAHNDKLSYELFLDGKCIEEDPGTYVYTALPEERDRFRSTKAHNTVFTGEEQNLYNGMFSMHSRTKCRVLALTGISALLEVTYGDVVHRRCFRIEMNRVIIDDECNKPFEIGKGVGCVSRGYGKLECAHVSDY